MAKFKRSVVPDVVAAKGKGLQGEMGRDKGSRKGDRRDRNLDRRDSKGSADY